MDIAKEDTRGVSVMEEDAKGRVRWWQMIC